MELHDLTPDEVLFLKLCRKVDEADISVTKGNKVWCVSVKTDDETYKELGASLGEASQKILNKLG